MFRKLGVTGAALLIAFACVAVMVVYIFGDRADKQHDRQQTIDTGYIGCLRYNDTRLLFRDILLDAYGTDTAPQFDLSALPQFQAINDQAVKDLLLLLTSSSTGDTATDRRDRSYARTGTRDCETEYPTHTRGLSITSVSTIPPPTIDTRP